MWNGAGGALMGIGVLSCCIVFLFFSIESVTFELNGSFSLSLVYVFRDLWIYKISTAIHPTRNPGFDSTTHKNHVTLISSSCWAIERPLYSFRSCKLFVFIICFWLLLALMLLWKMDHWGGWSVMTMLIVTAGWKKIVADRKPHLVLFALQNIERGDELTYDYGGSDWPWRVRYTILQYVGKKNVT